MQEITLQDIFKRAVLYRDNKIEGCMQEAAKLQAELMFLQLAQLGHWKAMFNYASIQWEKNNYEVAYEYFSKLHDKVSKKNCDVMVSKGLVKEKTCLIVGSNRANTESSVLIESIYGSQIDLSHVSSFGGKAVTMDIFPSKVPNVLHIHGDCTTFNFKAYDLTHVLLERLPTIRNDIPMTGVNGDAGLLKRMESNCISWCVKNVSKHMQTGAILEIELDPYVSCFSSLTPEMAHEFHEENPFHGVFNMRHALGAANIVYQMKQGAYIPPEILSLLSVELIDLMRSEMLYYHSSCGVCGSFAQLVDRVYWEMGVVHNLMRGRMSDVVLDCDLKKDSTERFISAYPWAVYGTLPGAYGERVMVQHPRTGEMVSGLKYNGSTFMQYTFYNFLLSSIAVQQNKPYIVRHLEKAGFRDVTVERRTNEHNGRRNVWMVRAVKA